MAYYTVVSATTIPGKVKEAVAAVQELAKHYNENYEGTVELLHSMDGPTDLYHWVVRHESLAAAEAAGAKWHEDPKYQAFAATSHELWKDFRAHRYEIL